MSAIRFGTSGWRAILSDEFTFANVGRVLNAITLYVRSEHLAEKKVVIGSDTRFLCDRFRQFAAGRLAANGIGVLVTDRDCPTPVISYLIKSRKLAGGINFTASHNPPEYQGLKFNPANAAPAHTEVTTAIEGLIDQPVPPPAKPGTIELIDPREEYFKELGKFIDFGALRQAKIKVACDVLYGAGRGYLDEVMRRAGAQVLALHNYVNPLFGGHRPEPAPENLGELMKEMKKGGYSLGLAVDGDADRFGIVDKGGVFFNANQVLCLAAWHLHRNRGRRGRIVRSVATTGYLDRIAAYLKTTVVEVPVGFKYIGPLINEGNVLVGGEESGGLSIGGHVPEKDGILACALIAELVAMEKKTLSEIWRDIEEVIGPLWTGRVDVTLRQDKKNVLMAELAAWRPPLFLGLAVQRANRLDGYKFVFNEAEWVLIRPSGTEPLVRCYIESDTPARGEWLKEALVAFVDRYK